MGHPAGVTEIVGVYHADGGALGEARYVIGKLLGRAHCSLCDVTHSPVRRKPAWDAMVARVGVPFTLVHLNEMPDDVVAVAATTGTPVVLGRATDGSLLTLLLPDQLEQLAGSVAEFERSLVAALAKTRPTGPGT